MADTNPDVTPFSSSEEQIRQLLDLGAESSRLDYKREFKPDDESSWLELAKDVAAMLVKGGDILIGADDVGRPAVSIPDTVVKALDESRVRAKLKKWIAEPLDFKVSTATIDEHRFALLRVAPHKQGLAIFRGKGAYLKSGDKRETVVFREGDVFVRHGTASERWNQHDIADIIAGLVEREKEAWRQEITEVLLIQHQRSTQIAELSHGPLGELNWQLDSETFLAGVLETFRRNDSIALRYIVNQALSSLQEAFRDKDKAPLITTILDRLIGIIAIAIAYDHKEGISVGLQGLGRAYMLPFQSSGSQSDSAKAYWSSIVERMFGVGALAVRLGKWALIPMLAAPPSRTEDFTYYGSWIRHGQVQGANSSRLVQVVDGRRTEISILLIALRHVERLSFLHLDMPWDEEAVLNSICQFDFLVALMMSFKSGGDTAEFYTSFARFRSHRVAPIEHALLSDDALREALGLPGDEQLAVALQLIDGMARKESFRYAGWRGLPPELADFVMRNGA